ncbi:hypothetical protein LIER_14204 [Lithospermum erythrorhizon]|uniref:Uncharacterized protein n=1 Tax=Lithospermum erythrorhizon TaxID=34254 RepID=A0AAV3PY86_LITER
MERPWVPGGPKKASPGVVKKRRGCNLTTPAYLDLLRGVIIFLGKGRVVKAEKEDFFWEESWWRYDCEEQHAYLTPRFIIRGSALSNSNHWR